jgi:hypothetical protein
MLESARYQWEEGLRRLESEGSETARYRHLTHLVEAVTAELRRRIGQTFTLTELADVYNGAGDWVMEVVLDAAQPRFRAGVRDSAVIQDAAFGLYARGASDYAP